MLQIIVALPLSFLLLYWIWPSILGWSIRRSSEGKWGGWIHGHVGPVIIGLSFILAIGLGSWFVLADKEKSWTDPEPAVSGLGIAAGAVFAYSRLFPPAFWPSFYEVINFHTTGEWKGPKLTEISIGQGQFWPIFMEVHNAGMTPWNNYRITVDFQEGGCQVYPEHPQVAASLRWQWKTVFRLTGEGQQFLQVQATNTLSVAEPQTIRFVVKAPDKGGRFKVRIKVVADGRLGESRRDLVINVVEGLQPPPIPVAA
jgi:hypothetical protein